MSDLVVPFHNDDPGYRRWAAQNPDGHILHQRTGAEYTIHHSDCGAVASLALDNLTKAPKFCSLDRGAVVRIAVERSRRRPCGCEQCGS